MKPPATEPLAPSAPARAFDPPLPRLTRRQFWSFFAVALAIFLFSTGPVWEHPWSIVVLDRAILYSYAAIPLLVASGLAWSKRLGLKAFFLDTLELTLLKYTVTFGLALVFWGLAPRPPTVPFTVPRPPPLPADSAPPPTRIAAGQVAIVRGRVTRHDGAPAQGALVYVASGLEGYVFAPGTSALTLSHGASGTVPHLAAAQLGQTILVRSTDAQLHTFVAVAGGRTMINVPLLRSGEPSRVTFPEAYGVMTVQCAVHQHRDAERPSTLVVLAHPFFAFTGEDGTYRFEGVPAGELSIAAVAADGTVARAPLHLAPGAEAALPLSLHPAE